jgi:hypothetical protein
MVKYIITYTAVGRTHDMGIWMEVRTHESANPRTHQFLNVTMYSNKKGKIEGIKEEGSEGRYRRGKRNGKKRCWENRKGEGNFGSRN